MLEKTKRRSGKGEIWSEPEEQIIKDNYETKSDKEIYKLMPHRTPGAIHMKRAKMGLMKKEQFSKTDDEKLENMYLDYVPTSQISKQLKRSRGVIQQRCRFLGLHRDQRITKLITSHGRDVLKLGETYEQMVAALAIDSLTEAEARSAYDKAIIEQAVEKLKKDLIKINKMPFEKQRDHRDQAIREARSFSVPLKRLSEVTGLSAETVRKVSLAISSGKHMNIARKLALLNEIDFKATIQLVKNLRKAKQ